MLSFLLGLMASSVIGFASAEDLQPCANAFYVPSQYNCFDGYKLCPILNSQSTLPCGEDCYLESMYSCDNGRLAPPAPSSESPSQDGTFLVVALESPYFSSAFIQAAGLVFRIGGGAPDTYCPDFVAQSGGCPAGSETVWTCSGGFCSLNVQVPGGQQIYVAPNGAVGYTQAHSGVIPPGSKSDGFRVENGELSFATSGFYACISADNSSYPQLYASALMTNYDGCYAIKLATATGNEPGFAAWQYT